jgi:hypothetical protein
MSLIGFGLGKTGMTNSPKPLTEPMRIPQELRRNTCMRGLLHKRAREAVHNCTLCDCELPLKMIQDVATWNATVLVEPINKISEVSSVVARIGNVFLPDFK